MDVFVSAVGIGAPDLEVDVSDIAAAWDARGRGLLRVCDHDEDALTLAWEAATACLQASDLPPGAVDGLWWGSTRPPFAEGPSHPYLAASLRLRDDTGGALLAGSEQAGIDALLAGWDAVAAGNTDRALVVASDALIPGLGTSMERRTGAGAVALLLTSDDGPARLRGRSSLSAPVLERYRGDGEAATRDLYDGRLIREQVYLPAARAAVDAVRLEGDVQRWVVSDLDGRARRGLATELDLEVAADELAEIGAATTLTATARSATTAGRIGVVTLGAGRVTTLTVDVTDPVPGADQPLPTARRAASYHELLRIRGQLVEASEPVPMGVPPGSAMFVRGSREMLAGSGVRCVECGYIATPPDTHPSCPSCGSDKLEVVPLDMTGTIHTFAVNQTMPAPFVAPLPILIVDLDDGARVEVQGLAGDDLGVGRRVRLVLRRYATERGAPIYGYKARVVG